MYIQHQCGEAHPVSVGGGMSDVTGGGGDMSVCLFIHAKIL